MSAVILGNRLLSATGSRMLAFGLDIGDSRPTLATEVYLQNNTNITW